MSMKNDETMIIEDGLVGLARELEKAGIKGKMVNVKAHGPDSFIARRAKMELARRKNQRTPK